MHDKEFLVIHTPGAFGNFMAWLIDCYRAGKMLPEPFNGCGASHDRRYIGSVTRSTDTIGEDHWEVVLRHSQSKIIGCWWPSEYFPYILHAYYGRTNDGQFGRCAVEYLQESFYDFVQKQITSDVPQQIEDNNDLRSLFNVVVDTVNKKVPRHVLRMYFWYKLIEQENNIVEKENLKIKQYPRAELISIEEILDYEKLRSFFTNKLRFKVNLNFKSTHEKFIARNRSLQEYIKSQEIFNAVKNGQEMAIDDISVMGEAMVLFSLEKHFFDIPFYNQIEFFSNTKQILEYVKFFPHVLRQPNKLFHKHYKKFQPNG